MLIVRSNIGFLVPWLSGYKNVIFYRPVPDSGFSGAWLLASAAELRIMPHLFDGG